MGRGKEGEGEGENEREEGALPHLPSLAAAYDALEVARPCFHARYLASLRAPHSAMDVLAWATIKGAAS